MKEARKHSQKILSAVKVELDKRSNIPRERIDKILSQVEIALPKFQEIHDSGLVVISIANRVFGEGLNMMTCTGGHHCEGDGPSDDNCPLEACDTQTCDDHNCDTQSCGTEACSNHSCTGTYKEIVDVSSYSQEFKNAWNILQLRIDSLNMQNKLEIDFKPNLNRL